MAAALALTFIGAPAVILGVVACGKRSLPREGLALACIATTAVSLLLQYVIVVAPMVFAGKASWDLFMAPLFGWHLAVPSAIAALLWWPARTTGRPALRGVVAGLLFSITAI